MVGKGVEPKSSRIFHQCYLKCCKLQNLTPLANLTPTNNGKVLDFCVDRIKYQDWPPILNALSCDLSLHSVAIKCRQSCKTVLEQIDCERLAKTVSKRPVILTNFLLNNLVEALVQLMNDTTLLSSLMLEGLPLKIPYLNPLCEVFLVNSSLQHLYLPNCLIGDAGCLAVCKAVRCLPNLLTLDLSGCDLTPLGAGYIAGLIEYQKIHRYSENWIHTLRYRMPQLNTMAGLRRISLCNNADLGDAGLSKVLEVLADDLWIKALDAQNCSLTEKTSNIVIQVMSSNTTLVVLDLRHNPDIDDKSLTKIRAALRQNERREMGEICYSWLSATYSSDCRSMKSSVINKNAAPKPTARNVAMKYPTKVNVAKKEKEYTELLQEQLEEEISHRQQLEELNLQLVEQMKQLKQQQMNLWTQDPPESGSEQSLRANSTYDFSGRSSTSSSSVPIDQNTLSYIQEAFKDIYHFIKNNQCRGECQAKANEAEHPPIQELPEMEDYSEPEVRKSILPKKVQSAHSPVADVKNNNKITKSAHILSHKKTNHGNMKSALDMFETCIGDSLHVESSEDRSILEEMIAMQKKIKKNKLEHSTPCSSTSVVSDSSATLIASGRNGGSQRSGRDLLSGREVMNPRDALCSSSEEDE